MKENSKSQGIKKNVKSKVDNLFLQIRTNKISNFKLFCVDLQPQNVLSNFALIFYEAFLLANDENYPWRS